MMTYSKLYESVADWLNRDDMADDIPQFVRMAELQIYRFLRIALNTYTKTLTGADDPYIPIALPNNYKEMKLLVVNGIPLERISDQRYYEELDGYNETDQPQYFTEIGNALYILPWPDAPKEPEDWDNTTINIHYYGSDSADMLDGAEDAYIYGAVMQGWINLSGPDGGPEAAGKAAQFEGYFTKALLSLEQDYKRRQYSGSTKTVTSAY